MKLKTMTKSLETIELALQLIDRIRNNYMSEESRIYLAENEKETYLFATHLAYNLYSATHDNSIGYKMYAIAQKQSCNSAQWDNGNELLYSTGIPDSLREKQNRLSGNIAAYNNLILEENRKLTPDSTKFRCERCSFWYEPWKRKVTGDIERLFPNTMILSEKQNPFLWSYSKEIKKRWDYCRLSPVKPVLRRQKELYVFLISRDHLDFRELWIDSLFVKNAEILRKTSDHSSTNRSQNFDYISCTGALNYMYLSLIKPIEELFIWKKLIIIPDEEIGWLSFDEFLKNRPDRIKMIMKASLSH